LVTGGVPEPHETITLWELRTPSGAPVLTVEQDADGGANRFVLFSPTGVRSLALTADENGSIVELCDPRGRIAISLLGDVSPSVCLHDPQDLNPNAPLPVCVSVEERCGRVELGGSVNVNGEWVPGLLSTKVGF
jgi:hypothetical protein